MGLISTTFFYLRLIGSLLDFTTTRITSSFRVQHTFLLDYKTNRQNQCQDKISVPIVSLNSENLENVIQLQLFHCHQHSSQS